MPNWWRKNKKKQKKNSHRRKVKRDEHHVYCRSRKKCGDLGKFKPLLESLVLMREMRKKHPAWHHIFSNLFPEEVISLIKEAFKSGLTAPAEIISFIKVFLRRERAAVFATKEDMAAWHELFNNYSSHRKIRKIIIKEWTYPGLKAVISNKRKVVKVVIFKKLLKRPRILKILNELEGCPEFRIIERKNGQLIEVT